jgi:hypothetical protein
MNTQEIKNGNNRQKVLQIILKEKKQMAVPMIWVSKCIAVLAPAIV